MKVVDIKWIIDPEDVVEAIMEMSAKDASRLLEISTKKFSKMNDEQKEDFIKDKVHHRPALAEEIMGLPNEVELPNILANGDNDAVADWLSDTYGFCHEGFLYDFELNY